MVDFSLKNTIKDYVFGQSNEDLVLARLNNVLHKTSGAAEFNKDELMWFKAHFDKIPNILKSKLACTMFLTIDKQRGAYLRQLCRKLGEKGKDRNPNAINYWLKKFFRVELLQKNKTAIGWGTEIYYYAPKMKYPNLIEFLKSIMVDRLIDKKKF